MQEKRRRFKERVIVQDFLEYFSFLRTYIKLRGYGWFSRFEVGKDFIVDLLYKKRGRYARPFLHFGTIGLVFLLITLGPIILNEVEEQQHVSIGPILNTATAYAPDFYTLQAEEVRQYRGGEITNHIVTDGETLSSIAQRYGLQVDTVLWENNLTAKSKIKPGQELKILPLDGVRHKVSRGETIFSIGKKYGLDGSQVQVIVDYPFNEFLNDETFNVVAGQYLMIPDGVKPAAVRTTTTATRFGVLTPDAGSVSASGSFIWPASGRITQGYRFYHKAIDIASKSGGPILAADSGVVTTSGWIDNSGYGNRVVIDHGNGFVTLYAHLSVAQVKTGQRVRRGDVIGQMGNSGRSTGTHLHFEIRQGGALLNPSSYLK
ncbi:MAG: M23 family metallopeptidase [Candidatus Pacebacteria bacterium]|jgi:murein DD-endopeptidase MepM/ murein hydrolase activator NlpD|nr:M23 family metallopeptidase [Candidatus Paceibacterota bacterium]MBT4652796.1 M23 family metallopeptidase [Candidatus Paceibacterota bacterium]MBT6755784.1 M23 family metallopeptidase [Candidatus Paceibacterota bacterium]MBT6921774.1 M23 family metallopeptidase [Candidatus Paceibacterota bacterium]